VETARMRRLGSPPGLSAYKFHALYGLVFDSAMIYVIHGTTHSVLPGGELQA